MQRLMLALMALTCALSAVVTRPATAQDDKKAAELEKKVAELEKKVAALEAALKASPKPDLDLKLVGSWANPQEKGETIVALRFEADGTGRMVTRDEKDNLATKYVRYELTGKVIDVRLSNDKEFGSSYGYKMTVVSVDGKQLTLKSEFHVKGAELKLDKQ